MDRRTAAQRRVIEAAAIASGQATGLGGMDRAGRGAVGAVYAEWPERAAGALRAVVLRGPGNMGGAPVEEIGGFVRAAVRHRQAGRQAF